jgi:S1-C subfamily serine protease
MPKKTSWGTTIRTIVFSILIGGASGVLATALTTSYLSDYAMELGELTSPLRLSQERPRVFPETYEDAVANVRDRVFPATTRLYPSTPASATGGYTHDEVVAQGAVLTSDGWVMFMPSEDTTITEAMRVGVGSETYAIERLAEDPVTGAVFVKSEAGDLPVLAFAESVDLSPGDQLFAFPARDAIHETALQRIDLQNGEVVSADSPRRRLILDSAQQPSSGTVVTNVGGELIGVVTQEIDGNPRVLPLDTILPSFRSLLRDGAIARPWIGLDVVNLRGYVGVDNERYDLENGALIPSETSIEPDSPAAVAGLRAGDVILAVDGRPLNGAFTLDELLVGYEPGDSVTLTVVRDEEELEVSVKLAQHPALNLAP